MLQDTRSSADKGPRAVTTDQPLRGLLLLEDVLPDCDLKGGKGLVGGGQHSVHAGGEILAIVSIRGSWRRNIVTSLKVQAL